MVSLCQQLPGVLSCPSLAGSLRVCDSVRDCAVQISRSWWKVAEFVLRWWLYSTESLLPMSLAASRTLLSHWISLRKYFNDSYSSISGHWWCWDVRQKLGDLRNRNNRKGMELSSAKRGVHMLGDWYRNLSCKLGAHQLEMTVGKEWWLHHWLITEGLWAAKVMLLRKKKKKRKCNPGRVFPAEIGKNSCHCTRLWLDGIWNTGCSFWLSLLGGK